ncbi:hypothetical protein BD324DRAFT_648769 [Kockovaella imperatae]|uniref:Mitochondrial zinc maintenance protein 1, mitochondrial n=1 Tax=Kockovaella imperatae TaxID=4999 RepID=A0A1Y1URD1_9TREE|nr:hypothetical protein BD324DRAFT_648769 [Kockovaella imperatae]ORX40167.1 hypothetical protein BD324DRAFT_648769 [Kockovaella imperatae]
MSFPSSLAGPARSAYRQIIRAARTTFQDDPIHRSQFMSPIRMTFASPTLTPPAHISDPSAKPEEEPCPCNEHPPEPKAAASSSSTHISTEEIAKRISEWKEVALFLRRNVVQGEQDESGSFRLRVTPETELGVNESIRSAERRPKATKEQMAAVFAEPA